MPERIREVMTADPVAVAEDATLVEAARAMRDRDIGDVVVMSDGEVVGILTDRDIVVRAIAEDWDPTTTTVGSVCSRQPHTIEADDAVAAAIELMRNEHIRRVPVVDERVLVGIVSLGDLAEAREPGSVLGRISAAPPDD